VENIFCSVVLHTCHSGNIAHGYREAVKSFVGSNSVG